MYIDIDATVAIYIAMVVAIVAVVKITNKNKR